MEIPVNLQINVSNENESVPRILIRIGNLQLGYFFEGRGVGPEKIWNHTFGKHSGYCSWIQAIGAYCEDIGIDSHMVITRILIEANEEGLDPVTLKKKD